MSNAEPRSMPQQTEDNDVPIVSQLLNVEIFVKDSRWNGEQAIKTRILKSVKMARNYLDDLLGTE